MPSGLNFTADEGGNAGVSEKIRLTQMTKAGG